MPVVSLGRPFPFVGASAVVGTSNARWRYTLKYAIALVVIAFVAIARVIAIVVLRTVDDVDGVGRDFLALPADQTVRFEATIQLHDATREFSVCDTKRRHALVVVLGIAAFGKESQLSKLRPPIRRGRQRWGGFDPKVFRRAVTLPREIVPSVRETSVGCRPGMEFSVVILAVARRNIVGAVRA